MFSLIFPPIVENVSKGWNEEIFDHARAKRHIIFVFKNSDVGTVH